MTTEEIEAMDDLDTLKAALAQSVEEHRQATDAVISEAEALARAARRTSQTKMQAVVVPKPDTTDLTAKFSALRSTGR